MQRGPRGTRAKGEGVAPVITDEGEYCKDAFALLDACTWVLCLGAYYLERSCMPAGLLAARGRHERPASGE